MSFFRDRQIRWYGFFLLFFAVLLVGFHLLWGVSQVNQARAIYTAQNEKIASSLLEQGVSREITANALLNQTVTEDGKKLLTVLGIGWQAEAYEIPGLAQFQQSAFTGAAALSVGLILLLLVGTALFFWQRRRLYQQANQAMGNYLSGDFTRHLPQNHEGAIFQLFSAVEQLATMLQSKNETEHKAREFLKSTISDISHQLKTPLAALAMYQEIIQNEPDNPETVREFSAKAGASLSRMEQLIQSMLKIIRLDTGNIVFEKNRYSVAELVAHAISDLTARSQTEGKQIQVDGNSKEQILCDLEWTAEAIGNLVKNALDHTGSGGIVRIAWERTPAMLRITVSDNGNGIALEDIHHIFKRFYRSKHALEMPGIGLGLPLAKSIVEGQGGSISVQSEPNQGTIFTLSFLTES